MHLCSCPDLKGPQNLVGVCWRAAFDGGHPKQLRTWGQFSTNAAPSPLKPGGLETAPTHTPGTFGAALTKRDFIQIYSADGADILHYTGACHATENRGVVLHHLGSPTPLPDPTGPLG